MRRGALLAPGVRTVTAALRVRELAAAHRCTHDQRVLNRATGWARQTSRLLVGGLGTGLVPPGATMGLGADDPVARRAGRKIPAKGGSREAVRASTSHGIHGVGLQWGSRRRWGPVPWARRLGAWPCLTALCGPAPQGGQRRHQTSVDGGRPMLRPGRLEAFCGTDLQATPVALLLWIVRRWSGAVTCEEASAQRGVETPRPGADKAMARTTPVVWGLCSWITLLALPWRPGGQMPVPATAWYRTTAPTFADCLALVRRPLGPSR